MADCYYHGQSAPGPCPVCERETRAGRDGSDSSEKACPDLTQDDFDKMNERSIPKKTS